MFDSILRALGEPALMAIVALSFRVTGLALIIAIAAGVPIGAVVGLTRFPGKGLVTLILYTGMGLPPVVVGLFAYMLLSRAGPFGSLGWLFTPTAMVVAQTVIAFPLVAGLTQSAVEAVDQDLRLQVRALGATRWQSGWTILREARVGVTAAIIAAFGGIISEVGAVMLVGGNIEGQTRVLTTAIVLSTRQGDFALAMALGIVLLLLTLGANAVLLQLQGAAAMNALAFEVTGLRQTYGPRTVLDLPHLEIRRGETLGIIGPSGAGKSTLLRLLQGVERPTEGHIRFDGHAFSYPVPVAVTRRITTVFQRPAMLDRTVGENVEFGLRLRGRRDRARVSALVERVGLQGLMDARARRLSGGEMQRVALARAIATGADVLLLDEPAANLDPANVSRIEAIVSDEQAHDRTIVLVTHNTHEARRLAHRTMLLIGGKMVEIGSTDALFDEPGHPETRAFLAGDLVY